MAEMPPVPLTLEGAWVFHQMFRLRRASWRQLDEYARERILKDARHALGSMVQSPKNGRSQGQTAIYSLVGHKGDLMLLHFRNSLEDIHRAELQLDQLDISEYLEPTHSYLSVVELGLYESSARTYAQLAEKNLAPHSPEWNAEVAEVIKRQSTAMSSRLYPEIPPAKYTCFYPMNRKRDERKNWYQEPMAERQRMMHDHGLIGRRYADSVRQIISGSIGFDDWEWAVDLFADDPLVFKKLIYEMRFDEVSAVYALFGTFYVGLRIQLEDLSSALGGHLF